MEWYIAAAITTNTSKITSTSTPPTIATDTDNAIGIIGIIVTAAAAAANRPMVSFSQTKAL